MKSSRGVRPMKRAEDLLRRRPGLLGPRDVLEAVEGEFGALHLADHRGVGQRVEVRERVEVDGVRLPVEEQRVGLDRVEHRRGRALGDVHVDGAQVLGEDGARRPVVRPDVPEHRAVAGLGRVVVDHEIDLVDEPREVVGLHVHHRDPIEPGEVLRPDRLDMDVEQVQHPEVLGPGHALDGADDGGGLRAAEQVPQGQPRRHGVGVRVVVQQDEHLVGVVEVPLELLHAGPGHRPADLGDERRADQVRQRQEAELGVARAQLVRPACRCRRRACRSACPSGRPGSRPRRAGAWRMRLGLWRPVSSTMTQVLAARSALR